MPSSRVGFVVEAVRHIVRVSTVIGGANAPAIAATTPQRRRRQAKRSGDPQHEQRGAG